jgi:hypothetical protein
VDRAPYAAALRIYAIAEERWAEIEAHYLSVDLLRLPPAKFTNAVYAWAVQMMLPEDREKWDAMLIAPLPGQERKRPSEAEVEMEGAAFMGLLQAETVRKKERTSG